MENLGRPREIFHACPDSFVEQMLCRKSSTKMASLRCEFSHALLILVWIGIFYRNADTDMEDTIAPHVALCDSLN